MTEGRCDYCRQFVAWGRWDAAKLVQLSDDTLICARCVEQLAAASSGALPYGHPPCLGIQTSQTRPEGSHAAP